jgi:hypothetical protein
MRHQVKSHYYYLFWLAMAIAVCGGQLYVGSGYRELAKQQKEFAESIYNQQMGWGPCQQALENKANKTGEFE